MSAFVLPNLDQSTIDELRKRIPDMSEIDLPKLENLPKLEKVGKDVGQTVGKSADQALDRLLGRSRTPVWPWVAASVAIIAIAGAVAAWFTWWRKPTSADTLVDEEVASWQGSTNGSGLPGDPVTDPATDQTIDRETSDAIGTFGEHAADEYPVSQA